MFCHDYKKLTTPEMKKAVCGDHTMLSVKWIIVQPSAVDISCALKCEGSVIGCLSSLVPLAGILMPEM